MQQQNSTYSLFEKKNLCKVCCLLLRLAGLLNEQLGSTSLGSTDACVSVCALKVRLKTAHKIFAMKRQKQLSHGYPAAVAPMALDVLWRHCGWTQMHKTCQISHKVVLSWHNLTTLCCSDENALVWPGETHLSWTLMNTLARHFKKLYQTRTGTAHYINLLEICYSKNSKEVVYMVTIKSAKSVTTNRIPKKLGH